MMTLPITLRKILFSLAAVAMLMLCFLAPTSVSAQVTGATLSGTVSDASGSAVANATVSIKNLGTGIVREVSTDSAGFYNAPNLPPEVYEVTTSATGFSTQVQTGLTLTVGAQQLLNCLLYTSPSPRDGLLSRMPSSA